MATAKSLAHIRIYAPLSHEKREIRLVTIKPVSHAFELVECSLSVHSLTNAPPFRALSYAWGDPNITSPIKLDGIVLPVTVNLSAALDELRKESGTALFWIDAICI
jgi:hypothetical protein